MSAIRLAAAIFVASVGRSLGRTRIERALAIIIAAGALILPLTFTIALTDVFALPKTVVMLGLSVLLLAGLLRLVSRRSATRSGGLSAISVALALYLVLTAVATLLSADPYHSLVGENLQYQGFLATLGYAVAFLAARRSLRDMRRVRRLFAVIVAGAVLVAGYGMLQQVGLDPIWHVLDKGRIFSTLGQANALAAYLVLCLPIALAIAGTTRIVGRTISALAAVAIAAALALTLSRGGYLGTGTALVLFFACLGPRSILTRRRVAIGTGVALATLASIVVFSPLTRSVERVVDRGMLVADLGDSSTASHLDLWAVGVRVALDNPFFGVGPEIYPAVFARYRDVVLPPARAAVMARFRPESPHDVPLAIADGAGLPALAAYIAVVVLAMLAGWRRLRQGSPNERWLLAALMAALAGHVVTDLFMTAEITGSWISWVLLGVLCATRERGTEARPVIEKVHAARSQARNLEDVTAPGLSGDATPPNLRSTATWGTSRLQLPRLGR